MGLFQSFRRKHWIMDSEQRVSFPNDRREILKGVIHQPMAGGFSRAVILCHGMESNKESDKIVALSRALAERGIAALRFDFSYSGESTGRFEDITYSGEVNDLEAAFNFMVQRGARRMGIVGSSMGGTVALIFAAEHPATAALVTVAAPLHPEKIAGQLLSEAEVTQWRRAGHVTYHGRRLNSSLLADLEKINVPKAARNIHCPLLIIHGDEDETVPVEEAYELYELVSNSKKLCVLQGGDHRFSDPSLLKKVLQESIEWITVHVQ